MTPIPEPTPGALQDRVVLITGAGSGIGQATACACAAGGATVVLTGRDVPRLSATYDTIVAAGGAQPAICPVDLGGITAEDATAVAGRIRDDCGRLDGIAHIAAQTGGLRPAHLIEAADWERLMRINLHGPWLLTQACLPLLQQAPDPALVFACDGHARRAYWGAYGVAKAAVDGLIAILAAEWESEPAVRVNGIDPGPVRTRLRTAAYPGELADLKEPEAIGPAFAYFLGSDSRGQSGQRITL